MADKSFCERWKKRREKKRVEEKQRDLIRLVVGPQTARSIPRSRTRGASGTRTMRASDPPAVAKRFPTKIAMNWSPLQLYMAHHESIINEQEHKLTSQNLHEASLFWQAGK
jgi:hypothetical protein